jgi:hypothetical protein
MAKTNIVQPTGWRNRIVGHGTEAPDQLLANPFNWRAHPKHQQDALSAVLDNVGWFQNVIVNRLTNHIVDGHLRVSLAISKREAEVPVVYVDLTEEEELIALATIDPLSAMAATDSAKLAELLASVQTNDAALNELLATIGNSVTAPTEDQWGAAFDALPDGDKSPFQQMTFTVSDAQADTIHDALAKAKKDGGIAPTDNENSNGNALWRMADVYLHG